MRDDQKRAHDITERQTCQPKPRDLNRAKNARNSFPGAPDSDGKSRIFISDLYCEQEPQQAKVVEAKT